MAGSGNYFLDTYGPSDTAAPAAAPQTAPAQSAPAPAAARAAAPPPKPTGNYFTDTYGPNDVDQPTLAKPKASAIHDTITNPALNGFEKGRQIGFILQSPMYKDEQVASAIAEAQQKIEPRPEYLRQADEVFSNAHGWLGVLDAYVHNPRAVLANTIQGLTQGGMVMGAAVAGGAAGGPEAAAVSAGGAAYLNTYGETILNTFEAHGVDLSDKDAVLAAMHDPALMAAAAAAGHKAGVPAAIINALSFGIAGRVAGPVTRIAGGKVAGRAAGAVGEVAAQGTIGAGGEAATEASRGEELNPNAITQAGLGQAAATAPFMAHGVVSDPLAHVDTRVVEAHADIMSQAQETAAAAVKAQGGDALDQTVAATQVNAEVGAHHDAAAVQGARDQEAQAHADALQAHQEQEARDAAFAQAEAEKGATPAQEALAKENAFQQADVDNQKEKDQDFSAAKNQVGEQAVEAAKTGEAGAEKGGANEPKPTLAEALPPEQLAALQGLKARRAAEAAQPPEETVQERMRAQARGTPDDFQELPAKAPETAVAPPEEAEPETIAPPPVKPADLAARRQAELDAKMAAKVRGPAPETPIASPNEVKAPPNRLGAIRAAAEKRAALSSERAENPVREPEGYVARNAETGDEIKRFPTFEEALAHKQANPDHDITKFKAPENDWFSDLRSRLAMPHDEAKEHLSGVSDAQGERAFQVHESATADTVPPLLAQQIKEHMAKGGLPPKGAYSEGVAHVFAGSHETGDKEDLLSTTVHELAHKGLESFLGPELGHTMDGIYRDVRDTAWAKRLVERRGMDTSRVDTQRLVANEYAAHMAENVAAGREVHEELPVKDRVAGHWQRVVDTVRAGLRKIGLVKHWNDNDIAALIRQAQAHSGGDRVGREGTDYKQSGPLFSLQNDDDNIAQNFAPDHPIAQAHKLARTMEEQAKYNPGFIHDPAGYMKEKWDDTLGSRLAFIGLRNLPDFLNERTHGAMSAVRAFIRTHDAMEGRRGRLAETGGKLALDWSKWATANKREAGNLGELMHAATIGGVDPSREFQPKYSDEVKAVDAAKQAHEDSRENLHQKLKQYYRNNLDDKGRELFNKVRDFYEDRRKDVLQGLEARINESGADGKTKQQLMSTLRQKFEQGRVQGPYFPLTRFGDHWARAIDSEGKTASFSRFESVKQKQAWMDEAKKMGFDVQSGKKADAGKSMMERIDPDFVKKVTELAKDVDPKLADEIWQEYLKAMPEMSMRKHLIHRQGRLGYSADALRGFAYNAFHGSHQIARLEYGNRLAGHLDDMNRQQEAAHNNPDLTDTDKNYATELTKEFTRRLDWINNPKAGAFASAMTKFGFGWYLGFAPATAFRILSQNPMLAQPILAKYHGQLGATRELTRASAQFIRSKGQDGLIDSLRGNERDAMEQAKDQGLFSSTWAQTLASGGEGAPMTGKMMAYNRAAAYLFNAAEHHNRATTYLAAYRLAVKNDMTHAQAMEHATDATWDSHFDYTNANRPRFMQNDFVKVAGLFKQYSLGVTYRLAREFRNMTRMDGGITREGRKQATVAMASLLGRSAMFSGVTGLPLYWVASNMLNYALGDKDNPVDSTALIHKQLNDTMGQTAGDAIMTGPMGALTGASLSTGASYNDLWYKPPGQDMSAVDQTKDALDQLGGAIPAIGLNAMQGVGQIAHGNIERGLEHFLPPALAGPVKAARYATQGVQNTKGEPIMKPEDMADRDKYLQAFGFTPQDVADQYAVNNARSNNVKELDARRAWLKNAYAAALSSGHDDDVTEAANDIAAFNEKNPEYAIGGDEASYIMNQAKQAATSINGINLPPRLRGKLEEKY
jgi:hypothetical protein